MRWPGAELLRRYAGLWLLAALTALCLAGIVHAVKDGQWLVTDMAELLPADSRMSAGEMLAQKRMEHRLNGQIAVFVGSADRDVADAAARRVAGQWQESGLFSQVRLSFNPDMEKLQEEAQRLQVALLPEKQRQLLEHDPATYFRERAEDIANPFSAPSLLPLSQDTLGFGRFILPKIQPAGTRMHWDAGTGMLQTESAGRHWVMLTAVLPEKAGVADIPAGLSALAAHTKHEAAQQGWDVHMAGGALFAAEAKAQAERESRWMSTAGIALTLLLLLMVFRSMRIVWILVPIAVGLCFGLYACIAVFGHVHVLTLVIGTSLVGVLIDFPLHLLVPGLIDGRWFGKKALRHVIPVFAIGFLVTAAGYLMLMTAPMTILKQTAVFSVAALLGALWATVCWLPALISRQPFRYNGFLQRLTLQVLTGCRLFGNAMRKPVPALAVVILVGWGCLRSNWHDDIRSWVHLSPSLLQDAITAADISGTDVSGRFLLVEAVDDDALLATGKAVSEKLAALPSGTLKSFHSLDSWVLPVAKQHAVQKKLLQLAEIPAAWHSLTALGLPDDTVRSALLAAGRLPETGVADSLKSPLAEAWRDLYLGPSGPGKTAALIGLEGVGNMDGIRAALAGIPGVTVVDRLARLNHLFAQTRDRTLLLKLCSFVLAWWALWWWLGIRRATGIICVPLAGAAAVTAVMGWLGIPVGLFVMFGLLLVSAIGVDYALCLLTSRDDTVTARAAGLLPAAATTLVSFGLLGLSSTPAVAHFGLTVAAGVFFNLLFSFCAACYFQPEHQPCAAGGLPGNELIQAGEEKV